MVERWLPDHPTPEEEPAVRDTPRPTPTRDLDDESEIAEMVRRFYADVAQDDLLGPMFNDVAQVDWSEHLPKLTAFWSRALLGRSGYAGNPFRAHALVHAQQAFTVAHFERWLDRKSTRLTSSHPCASRMPSSACTKK